MCNRRLSTVLPLVLALVTLGTVIAPALADINPVLIAAVSRKSHGGSSFDIALPLTGNTGVECRRISGAATLVLSFDQPVNGGTAAVSLGTGAVSGAPLFSANTMTVNLTGVADHQMLSLTVSNVTTAAGGNLPSATVNLRFVEGDVNSNGQVTTGDTVVCKANAGQPVTVFNFRSDINRNSAITAGDVSQIKAKASTAVPGGITFNTAPTIGDITDKTTNSGTVTLSVAIGDAELDASALGVRAVSDNPTLCPASSFTFSGTGATRTLTITTAANQVGTANVTVSVSDGLAPPASDSFVLTVLATPHLFLSNLNPMSGVITQGWGQFWLSMDGDETAATVNAELSTLTSATGPLEIRNASNTVLVNLASLTPQPDGSYRWIFSNPASDAAAIKSGSATFVVKTASKLLGEISGPIVPAASLNFLAPPPPPALPNTSPTPEEASRFLHQASFGPTSAEIANVQSLGYATWLDRQLDPAITPPSLVYPIVYQRCTTSSASGDSLATDRTVETWWRHAITANDQLRQRVATALSEIFVVSAVDDDISGQPAGLATYYDLLINDAFSNFRTLLEDVTLHPIMGQYLTMRGNVKPTSPRFLAPNENYAREIMQLLSIGLLQLNPDGTPKLNASGSYTQTYTQSEIIGFAHVFTGWNTDPTAVVIPTSQPAPATQPLNVSSFYNKPMVVNGNNHSTNSKLLLNGQVIPANPAANATAAQSIAELDTALDNIFNHPNVGPFICKQLIQRLVTSNPSPAYVYRCAQVFANDGTGVRGNMQAVIRAILLDYEARTTSLIATPGYGHLREPIVKYAGIIRAFHPTSTSGMYKLARTDGSGQTILRANTVFNFFEPGFSPPGYIGNAGMLAPEFQIASETNTISGLNSIYNGIFSTWTGGDVAQDFTTERDLASHATTGTDELLDRLNLLMMSGQMPIEMRNRIKTRVTTVNGGTTTANFLERARTAVHLVATSPQFATQR